MNTPVKMLTALATGVIVGILFAPNKGRKTRKKLTGQGKKLTQKAKYTFSRGKDKLNEFTADIEKAVKEKAAAIV